ncbi:MAG: stage III sporulation protein AF [Syntrophomonadaceae bacterium]|nr:stage III sporulation protein AF [Syntrophomonadaceae bacterium]
MEILGEIVRNLLVIIIIASILEMMLPEGNTRPFVRLTVGMFVLIAILVPTLNYLSDGYSFRVSAWDDSTQGYDSSYIDSTVNNIQGLIKDQSSSLLRKKLEEQLTAVAILVPGVDDVQADLTLDQNGNPRKLGLIVRSSRSEDNGNVKPVEVWAGAEAETDRDRIEITGKMTKIITNLYGLEAEDIEIVFEGS